jgi:hypothetical protein
MHATCHSEIQFRWRYAIIDVFNVDILTHSFSGTFAQTLKYFHPDDGGSTFLWSIANNLPDYTASRTRKQQYLQSQSWQPQISQPKTHKISNRSKSSRYSVFKTRRQNFHASNGDETTQGHDDECFSGDGHLEFVNKHLNNFGKQ